MRISAGFTIAYDCPQPVPMLLTLSVHPGLRDRLLTPEWIRTDPGVEVRQYLDGFGNLCSRVLAPTGRFTLSSSFDISDDGAVDICAPCAGQVAAQDLPDSALVYLLGSRYCETDQLMQTAWSLFGGTLPGWARVQAVCDFVHGHIRFGYEHARVTRSAWFEVYLDHRWYAFDARNNQPRIGRVLIARGRDATDVAMVNSFGPAQLVQFSVVTVERARSGTEEGSGPC